MATSAEFQSKLDYLPDLPGVYLFRDGRGDLLYIGKAAVLSNRVRSYFQKGTDHSPKNTVLVSHIADLETIVTRSELEALILESNLIKQHRPRFNVVLRDDKQYPYLRLPIKEDFPRLSIVRRVQQDGALYYGPYTPEQEQALRALAAEYDLIPTGGTDFHGPGIPGCVRPVGRTLAAVPWAGRDRGCRWRETARSLRPG